MFNINKRRYLKNAEFFKQNKNYFTALQLAYKWLPILMFVAYPVLLVCVWFFKNDLFWKVLIVPAAVFALVTVLRKIINEQRPYEKYNVPPLFNKTTKGQSMPSRHTASAFIIAMAFLYVNIDLGITTLCISTIIAFTRLFAGVHYVRDVLAGAGISVVAGIILFFLI